jgi:hypothetical protein
MTSTHECCNHPLNPRRLRRAGLRGGGDGALSRRDRWVVAYRSGSLVCPGVQRCQTPVPSSREGTLTRGQPPDSASARQGRRGNRISGEKCGYAAGQTPPSQAGPCLPWARHAQRSPRLSPTPLSYPDPERVKRVELEPPRFAHKGSSKRPKGPREFQNGGTAVCAVPPSGVCGAARAGARSGGKVKWRACCVLQAGPGRRVEVPSG